MQVVPLALFYLGSVAFFGAGAAKLDLASDSKRKWPRWVPGRVRRAARLVEAEAPSLVHVREAQGQPRDTTPLSLQPAASLLPRRRREEGLVRPKRHDRSALIHTYLRMSCNLGTCVTANLADQIYHLNNKDKDPNAPPRKISPHGYGRRRRRSLGDPTRALRNSSGSSERLPPSERRWRRAAPPLPALRALQ